MTRRSPARMRPAVDAAPRLDVVQSDKEALTGGGFTALLESVAQEILAVTYWFDPAPHPGPYAVTVRFSGRRIDVKGRLQPGDRFVQDETIEEVVHAGVRLPCTWAEGAREREPCGWSARSNCAVLAQVGAVRGVGRTCENVPDPPRPGAGDLSRHLGSDGDAWHGCRAGAPVPGDFR